ncbi:hypothetical protein ARMGADRAFT_130965 [Armillaria gallica]|uniref:Uncharacterized protein n=1 Tax=Armillaria gallica TaxID=47427 RepID=A0A2H3DX20_ARMGA|nr:hypothetical protein ARMGADRAFT_130965 [Armillaria gallica]
MGKMGQRLHEEIHRVSITANRLRLGVIIGDELPDIMVANVDVFDFLVRSRSRREADRSQIVTVKCPRTRLWEVNYFQPRQHSHQLLGSTREGNLVGFDSA